MDSTGYLILAIVGGGFSLAGFFFSLALKQARRWGTATREAAKRFQLKFIQDPTGIFAAGDARARGKHQGLEIEIGEEHVSQPGYNRPSIRHTLVEVSGDIDRDLFAGPPGQVSSSDDPPGTVDFSKSQKKNPRRRVGDPALDAIVELHGAKPRLLEALRDTELGAELGSFVTDGGTIEDGEIILRTTWRPTNPRDFVDRLERMVHIAKALEELQP